MDKLPANEKEAWEKVEGMLGEEQISLAKHWSFNILNDPKRLAFVLSRYKFAGKIGCANRSVIELGCSEGLGGVILAEKASSYCGVDYDDDAVSVAKTNWTGPKYSFIQDDFLGKSYGTFQTAVSLDVIEHIELEYEDLFFQTLSDNLVSNGRCIVGTPNKTSEVYASEPSKAGHVNVYTYDRLKAATQRYFKNVFMFGINDEIVHTGFHAMCHYIVAVGCTKKEVS